MARFAEAIEQARVDVVPKIVIGGGGHGGNGNGNGGGPGLGGSNILEGLLALLLSDRVGIDVSATSPSPSSPEAQAIREDLRSKLATKPAGR
jgi:hypothetical protein